ncbi:MAG TPA: YbhB/YbcL family Raf kinase inhibitor-like protein [Polyangiaceae bacterium]
MGIAHEVVRRLGSAARPLRSGSDKLATVKLGAKQVPVLNVTSGAFRDGQALPRSATADGENVPPTLTWRGVPSGARSIVVLCEDPDAPLPKPFVHWMVYGLPARDTTLDASLLAIAQQGKTTLGAVGYTGAAPPPGHGVHNYHFQVFALDITLTLGPGTGRGALLDAMDSHVVAAGDLVGTYSRE